MLRARYHLKNCSILHQYLCSNTNYLVHYSQRCDTDDCNCIIHQPKCQKRPELVREVVCEKCIFDCWEYKPRPKFIAPKTQTELRKEPRDCSPTMKDPKWRNVKKEKENAALCRYTNRTDAEIGHCPETFKSTKSKDCEENPFKFEDEKIPLPDWDFNKKPEGS